MPNRQIQMIAADVMVKFIDVAFPGKISQNALRTSDLLKYLKLIKIKSKKIFRFIQKFGFRTIRIAFHYHWTLNRFSVHAAFKFHLTRHDLASESEFPREMTSV
jgi:hypothetical protein